MFSTLDQPTLNHPRAKNAYKARLSILKPGVVIDALKDDIRDVEKTTIMIIRQMKTIDEFIVKTKVLISDTLEK